MDIRKLSGAGILNSLIAEGFGEKVFTSLDEARESKQEVSVVVHADGNYFELYVVGYDEEEFGEYVSWNADEFEEEPDFIDTAFYFVYAVLSSDYPVERIFELNPNLTFTPYD